MNTVHLRSEEFTEREKRNLAILEILRRFGPVTRPEISRALGLNIVTVSNYIEEFINKNLVFEKEFDVSEGGRRPVLLDINPDSGLVIGVGVNLLNIVATVVDFKGRVSTRSSLERRHLGVKDIINCIIEVISATLKKTKNSQSRIKGIGIGIAGIVNKKDGSLRWPEKVGNSWDYASIYVPLKNIIEKEFGLPVTIENDATSACFGEQWLDLEPGIKNLIYMFSGVGCGIMINGEIYTGSSGSAGEVSIYNPKDETPFSCSAGNPCFLKRWDIDFGLPREAREIAAGTKESKHSPGRIIELADNKPEDISLKHIFHAARENDPLASELLDGAAKQFGIKVAYLVNLLNPEVVVVGGGLEQAGERFLNVVKSTVDAWAFEEMSSQVRIVYSTLGENAVSLGAASLVMRQVFSRV
ncbi:MAG TPA: ROK family transcriptional regulator [Candidatus Omnitrophota bacterium]|nr:ROK family transcriptional regulator [Candidatus Omnitrophota bacterium]